MESVIILGQSLAIVVLVCVVLYQRAVCDHTGKSCDTESPDEFYPSYQDLRIGKHRKEPA